MNETNKNQISKLEKMKAFVEIAIFKKKSGCKFPVYFKGAEHFSSSSQSLWTSPETLVWARAAK